MVILTSPITSWQIDGEAVGNSDRLYFGGQMKLKDALWKKSYDQPRQHIKKLRQQSFANKGPSVKAVAFPVVMYGCESWTLKKAEH